MKPRRLVHEVQPSIDLHIERLVLEGLPIDRSQGGVIQRAVETALADMFQSGDLTGLSSRAEHSLRASPLRLTASVSPSGLGQQIGAAVYGALNQSDQQPKK
jgi:hypothetical protein